MCDANRIKWEHRWAELSEGERWCVDFAVILGPGSMPAGWIHQLTRRMRGTAVKATLSIRNREAEAIDRLIEAGWMASTAESSDHIQVDPEAFAWRTPALAQTPARHGACGNAVALFAIERAKSIKKTPEGWSFGPEAVCLLDVARKLADLGRPTVALELVTAIANAAEEAGHGRQVEELLADWLARVPENEYRFRHVSALIQLGRLRHHRKAYAEACATFERAIVLGREKTDSKSGSEAVAHCQLGQSLSAMDDLTAAEREMRYAITLLRQHLSPDHPRLGVPYHELAALLYKQGKRQEAIDYFERAIEAIAKADADGKVVAESYLGIATAQIKVEYFRGALPPAERALEIRQRRLRADDPKLLPFYNILAIAQRGLRDHARAIETLRIVLDIKCKTVGDFHADTLGTRTLLAKTYEAAGSVPEAIHQWEQILAIRAGRKEDTALSVALNNYAINLNKLKRYENALAQYERAIGIQDRVLDENDARRPASYLNTAVTLRNLNRHEEALARAMQAVTILRGQTPRDEAKLENASKLIASLTKHLAGI